MSDDAARIQEPGGRQLRLFFVAGEHSGDALGAKLMAAIGEATHGSVHYLGVGGPHMEVEGLASQFPMAEVAVMGPIAILKNLPRILKRIRQTVDAAVAAEPDAVVIIDSPEFTHPIARRIRARAPHIPIIDYVSPSVWAWRPKRAKRMRAYIDHVLALLPFEPAAHERLGGPPCSYVGHPLIERQGWIAGLDTEPLASRLMLSPARPVLVVLPGSRSSEVERLMPVFGATVARLAQGKVAPEVILPVVESVRRQVEGHLARWSTPVHLVSGEEDKFRAFRMARAALAASGTVTLELALAGTPMVVAYRVEGAIVPLLRRLIFTDTVILANHVLGRRAFPEFIQEACTAENLAAALADVMAEGPTRLRQLEALAEIPGRMFLASGTPSEAAARIVLDIAEKGRGTPAAPPRRS